MKIVVMGAGALGGYYGSFLQRAGHDVVYVARGEHLFGESGAELALIRHNLGDVPLAGFFANGEIADGRLHGYTGVLATQDGTVVDIVTRIDLIHYWDRTRAE